MREEGARGRGCGVPERGRPICMVISTGRSRRSDSSLSRAYYAVAPKKRAEGRKEGSERVEDGGVSVVSSRWKRIGQDRKWR